MLRASSPGQLDFPAIHSLSRGLIEGMFPGGPKPFLHPNDLEDALALSQEYQIISVSTYDLLTRIHGQSGF